MCIATDFALVGFDIISNPDRRKETRTRPALPGFLMNIDPHRSHQPPGRGPKVVTLELAGGSIRCLLAGVHLARRY
jgi:hypothetical protein